MNSGLPVIYDQAFPEQRWTTYLLLDSHPNNGQQWQTLLSSLARAFANAVLGNYEGR